MIHAPVQPIVGPLTQVLADEDSTAVSTQCPDHTPNARIAVVAAAMSRMMHGQRCAMLHSSVSLMAFPGALVLQRNVSLMCPTLSVTVSVSRSSARARW